MLKAPIAFFAYKRPEHARKSLESLSQNEGAKDSELFIFCDGAKGPEDEQAVKETREVVKNQQWCGKVNIIERQKNIGLAQSITSGVTQLCEDYGRVIVVEDDLILSPYFLTYMNLALDKYQDIERVMHIAGYMWPVKEVNLLPKAFFLSNTACWGWATWERAWQHFKLEPENLLEQVNLHHSKFDFNFLGTRPYYQMLEKTAQGEIESWAICWYATIFLNNGLSLYPKQSLVQNIGFDGTGSNCSISSNFDTNLSQENNLIFPEEINEKKQYKQVITNFFYKINQGNNKKYSWFKKILNKIKTKVSAKR